LGELRHCNPDFSLLPMPGYYCLRPLTPDLYSFRVTTPMFIHHTGVVKNSRLLSDYLSRIRELGTHTLAFLGIHDPAPRETIRNFHVVVSAVWWPPKGPSWLSNVHLRIRGKAFPSFLCEASDEGGSIIRPTVVHAMVEFDTVIQMRPVYFYGK
jgi:hypothetical protein